MFRSSRWRLAVLWLLLALLPLRGLAHELMTGWQGPVDLAAAGLPTVDLNDAPPCHGHDAPAAGTTSSASCLLCDLCHGMLALPSVGLPAAESPGGVAVQVPLPSPSGRPEADPFFRPPRG